MKMEFNLIFTHSQLLQYTLPSVSFALQMYVWLHRRETQCQWLIKISHWMEGVGKIWLNYMCVAKLRAPSAGVVAGPEFLICFKFSPFLGTGPRMCRQFNSIANSLAVSICLVSYYQKICSSYSFPSSSVNCCPSLTFLRRRRPKMRSKMVLTLQ